MNQPTLQLSVLIVLAAATAARAQDARPIAFTNARILTAAAAPIERGTLVVRNGKVEAVGADVAAPAGARIVDATGKTILPGFVSAWSRAGLNAESERQQPDQGGRRGNRGRQQFPFQTSSSAPAANKAATKVVDSLYARQKVFGQLLGCGITSLALTPQGNAFPGLGAVLDPSGKTITELTSVDDAFVQIGMARDASTKKMLKETFEKAKKLVEERKKPPEAPKPAEEPKKAEEPKPAEPGKTEPPKGQEPPKPEPKPEPTPEPKPEPKPEPTPPQGQPQQPAPAQAARPAAPKDPNLEVLADLLEGKRRAIVEVDSAADVLHWRAAVADDVKFPRTLVVSRHDPYSGTIDLVTDELKKLECPVLLPIGLSTKPRSRILIDPAKALHDAGIDVGFWLPGDQNSARSVFFMMTELVRAGLPVDVAVRGLTLAPAKALGIDKTVGSLEVGKDANLLVCKGDPFSATGELESVWLRGQAVDQNP